MSPVDPDPYRPDRLRMVAEQIRGRQIRDDLVCRAMEEIPRDRFVADSLRHAAYEDRALPIDCGQTISQPYMVAIMTQALGLQSHHRVLEIGTGSGYQTAVLARLLRHVITIERIPFLAYRAQATLKSLGIDNVSYVIADGSAGLSAVDPSGSGSPYPLDRILVTAGAPEIPRPLVNQLAEGGRLVIPVGGAEEQELLAVDRKQGRTTETWILPCRFVKLIGDGGW